MRKIKLQVQVTADGYMAGPEGEMDWMVWNWDDSLKDFVRSLTEKADGIVLGRKLAEGFIPHWAGVAADPENPEQAAGRFFHETPKYVFTRTLETSPWENAVLMKGKLKEEINRLKNSEGQDIMAYGGAEFVSSMLQEGLIDDIYLFVNPAAIGKGMPVFGNAGRITGLRLAGSASFPCGIAVLHYQPSPAQ